jgi:hypothetical protein
MAQPSSSLFMAAVIAEDQSSDTPLRPLRVNPVKPD